MHYPRMNTNPSVNLKIPSFNGGINTSAAPQDIQDNQAVAMSNMWLKDGTIQTRPALKKGSDNAYFLDGSKLSDLGIEAKLGYESYSNDDISQGDSKQHTYRLMLTENKQFLLYDLHENSFSTVEMWFQNNLYQSCLNEGKVESKFFYTNGLGDAQLKTDDGYKQTFFTEVYGFMLLSGCESLENGQIKLLFYLEPYVSDDVVKFQLKVYNAVKDLPLEHQPYIPTVAVNFGTGYGENLEDFNLMTGAFYCRNDVNKSTQDLETTAYQEFFAKGFGDGSEEYGNFNRWDLYTIPLPKIDNTFWAKITVYGNFIFRSYQIKEWSQSDIDEADKNSDNVKPGIYGLLTGDEHRFGLTSIVATATHLELVPEKDTGNLICTFYDRKNNAIDPGNILDKNGDVIPYLCCKNATAEITDDGQLKIWFPAHMSTVKTPAIIRYHTGDVPGTGLVTTETRCEYIDRQFHTADIFIEQIHYLCYQNSYDGTGENWTEQNQSELVTKNTFKTWYGGTNSGYAGGTRLFVAGHPELKNVVRWSNVNDSSYFLENNFSYVGRDDEGITALDKQDGYLVVFKEKELYALEYTYTTDAKNNALVYFPITPISPYIGCDCPNTIQLIANRLTWLSSVGKVYTLYSANSYSERNVRELSQHIENELSLHSKEELKNAKSVDYDNNYIIFVGKTAYIWNYDLNPFYNYSSSEQAQKRLAWFKWDFPYPVECAYNVDGELVVICDCGNNEYQGYVLDYDRSYDDLLVSGTYITSGYKSKLFDFGKPFSFKKINRAFFEVIPKSTGDFYIRFFTDEGTEKNSVMLTANSTEGYMTYSLRPNLHRVRGAGFEFISKTPVKLLSASITAEIYGEVK